MTTKMMHVKGVLAPANKKAVTVSTSDRMDREMSRHQLVSVLRNHADWDIAKWKVGVIETDTCTETNGGGRPAALDFITRLYNVITSPGIKELQLQGELMVTVEGAKEPVVFRVTVENENVFYNEANLVWQDEPIAFM